MTEAEIAASKREHLAYRNACRMLVRRGAPSRVGAVGPLLWDFACDLPIDAPVAYRLARGRYDGLGR